MPHRIAVIGGDGIGPEVAREAVATLEAAAAGRFAFTALPYGAQHTLDTGVSITDEALDAIGRDYDAILLGALGDPRLPDLAYARDILLGMRQRFALYANLRPARLVAAHLCPLAGYDAGDIDLLVVRENTEGLYTGEGSVEAAGTDDEVGRSTLIATFRGTARVLRFAFAQARARRGALCMATKHNAAPHAFNTWVRAFDVVRAEFPDVDARWCYVDALAMELVQQPQAHDVIVAENLLGDVLSDLTAGLVGGLGLAASANIHPGGLGLFEPVHGSAPDLVGRDAANPMAAIASAALMARHLGEDAVAARVEAALLATVLAGDVTQDLDGPLTTGQCGGAVRARLAG